MLCKKAEPLCRCKRIALSRAVLEFHGDISRAVRVLHCVYDRRVVQDKSAALYLLCPLGGYRLIAHIGARREHDITSRNIQNARRHDIVSVQHFAVFAEGEQVQEHLKPHAVPHIAERKALSAGLVVDDPQVELTLMQPAVDTVGNAGENQAVLALAKAHGRKLACLAEVQLKRQRHEV